MRKLLVLPLIALVALGLAACGSERIRVPKVASEPAGGNLYHGAVLFSERCAGCHTLDAAGTHGSAPNIRTAEGNSGPNFNQRCERPIDRVLYAIENGGFSGQYMPQNIVVGQDAVDVAEFVSRYAGVNGAANPGQPKCHDRPIGTLPAGTAGLGGTDGSSSLSSYTAPSAKKSAAQVASRRSHAKKHSA